jgi:MFS family permease
LPDLRTVSADQQTERLTVPTSTGSPVRELLSDGNFRSFWIAQVLAFGVNGVARFTFVWLIVSLTDWSGAEGLVGVALGVPALFLSLPAGAWSDRLDRIRYSVTWMAGSAVVFGVFAAVIAFDLVTPRITGVAAVLAGTTMVLVQPNLNAIVPLLVPKERLMNAAALQNGGAQAAGFLGLAAGGGIVALFGNAAGFGLLAVIMAVSATLMSRVVVHEEPKADAPRRRLLPEIAEGLRYGLGHEPSRSLLIATLILGSSFSVMQIAMPRVVKEDFGRGPWAAAILLGMFGIGMLVSSAAVARRRESMRHGLNVALFIGIGLGMGQFLLSLAPNYWVALLVMVAWGVNAGIAIASHRTLLQQRTEPAMMGRVMGIMTLGFSGGLPFGALTQAVLAPAVGPVLTMRYVGLATMAITIPLLFRAAVRTQ